MPSRSRRPAPGPASPRRTPREQRTGGTAAAALALVCSGCLAPGALGDPRASGEAGTPSDPPPRSDGAARWVDGESDPGPGLVRRLTRGELLATIEDQLGLRLGSETPAHLPTEASVDGFRNSAVGLVTTADHVSGWRALARAVLAELGDEGLDALIDEHAPGCAPGRLPTAEDGCTDAFVGSLLGRLFRRPPSPREQASFRRLAAVAEDEGMPFRGAAGLILEAALQAPPFLYRLEGRSPLSAAAPPAEPPGPGDTRLLDGFELATRLAYFLWGTAPDEALLAAAADGTLEAPAGLRRHARRMLQDPVRGPAGARRFVDDWLGLHRLLTTERDGLDRATAVDLRRAARETWVDLVWNRGLPLVDALVDDWAMLPPSVAEGWYDLPASGAFDDGLERHSTAGLSHRVGLLTQPGVIAAMSDRSRGGLVARGLYLLDRVLCGTVDAPPSGVDLSLGPGAEAGAPATERAASDDRLEQAACAGCHRRFDPLAYAFAPYDGLGRHRPTTIDGMPLRVDGFFPGDGSPAEAFDDVEGFLALLVADPRVGRCLTEKHLQYALGRPVGAEGAPWVDAIHRQAREAGGGYRAVALAIVQHGWFRTVRRGP